MGVPLTLLTVPTSDSEEEDTPRISIRNIADIQESQEEGQSEVDDDVVFLEDTGIRRNPAKMARQIEVLDLVDDDIDVAEKERQTMITYDDSFAGIVMTSEGGIDDPITQLNEKKAHEHATAKGSLMTIREALVARKERLERQKQTELSITTSASGGLKNAEACRQKTAPGSVSAVPTAHEPVCAVQALRMPQVGMGMTQNNFGDTLPTPPITPAFRSSVGTTAITTQTDNVITTTNNLSTPPHVYSPQQTNNINISPARQLLYDPVTGFLYYPTTLLTSQTQGTRNQFATQTITNPQPQLFHVSGDSLRQRFPGPRVQNHLLNQNPCLSGAPVNAGNVTMTSIPTRPPLAQPRHRQPQQPALVRRQQLQIVRKVRGHPLSAPGSLIRSVRPVLTPRQPLLPPAAKTTTSSLPEITAGNQKPVSGTLTAAGGSQDQTKTFPSLVVQPKPQLAPRLGRQVYIKARTNLDTAVKALLTKTPSKFTEWLLTRGLIRLDHSCNVHTTSHCKLAMCPDTSLHPFSGGYLWTLECCPQKRISVFDGSIFEGSKHPPGTLLKLLYHWACQTPSQNILQWVDVSSLHLKDFFTLIRAVCISWLHESCPLLGGNLKYVEIGVVTIGSSVQTNRGTKNVSVEILGVLDPVTKRIRLKVINGLQVLYKEKETQRSNKSVENGARAFQILWAVAHWVDKSSILLVDGIIDKILFHHLGFKNVVQCSKYGPKSSPSNVNIMNYLRDVVPKMFSATLGVLSRGILQQFLDELCWREIHGRTSYDAFENLLDHCGALTKWKLNESLIDRLRKTHQNPLMDWSYTKQRERSPLSTIPLTLRNSPGIDDCIRLIISKDKMKIASVVESPSAVISAGSINLTGCGPPAAARAALSAAAKRKCSDIVAAKDAFNYQQRLSNMRRKISMHHFYYAHTHGYTHKSTNVGFNPNLKCPLCSIWFITSKDIIRHMIRHVSGQDFGRLSDINICVYCLKRPSTGKVMLQHIEEVSACLNFDPRHISVFLQTACRICELQFSGDDELILHMWEFHNEAECPYYCEICTYASSLHYDLIDHFYREHCNLGSVICSYCLKVLPVKSSQMLESVVVHLQSHHINRAKKCTRCVLQFASQTDLGNHLAAHVSRKTTKVCFPFGLSSKDSTILMPKPPPPRTPFSSVYQSPTVKKQKLSPAQRKTSSSLTLLNSPLSVLINTNQRFGGERYKIKISGVQPGTAICAECRKDITAPNHFVGRLICSKCRFITSCQGSMDLHHERSHKSGSNVTKPGIETRPVKPLADPLTCRCGFLSRCPYKLASHLMECEKTTVFPKKSMPSNSEEVVEIDDDNVSDLARDSSSVSQRLATS